MKIQIRHFSLKHNISNIVDFPGRNCPHSSITIVKLWLPEILPDVHRILFLDSDIINCGPISDIWDYDMKDKTILATMRVKRWWINSGFIFYNLDLLRKRNEILKCGLQRNSCFIDDYYHTTCHYRSIQILPYRYNVEFIEMVKKDKDNMTREYRLNEENHAVFFHLKDRTTHNFYLVKRNQLSVISYARRSSRVMNFLQILFNIRDWVDSELMKLDKSIFNV